MDLNLYLGLPRSPRRRSFELGCDLSLSSFPLPILFDSSKSRAPEATYMAMGASASHAPHSPFHAFIEEPDVPLAGPWPPAVENSIPPCYLAYEPYGPSCVPEFEGPSIVYSPSNCQVLQTEQWVVEPEDHASFDEMLGLLFVDDNSAQGDGSQTPYSPSYHLAPEDFHDDENIATFLSLPSENRSEPYSRADGSSSLLPCPEFRIGRYIESHAWWQSPEQLMLEMMSSQQSIDTNGKQKEPAEVVTAESSESEVEDKNRGATNFDCNICFDIAKEPVVTSCGHLFCWPCLYNWLHVHSDHKECPLCKGEVTEANITPIYGRGCSRSDVENKDEEKSASGLSIPPRPCGNRLESWRQHSYPISRRIEEGRRFLNYHIDNRSRFSGHEDILLQEILNGSPAILTRSFPRRIQRERGNTEDGPSTVETGFPRDGGIVSIHNEIDSGRGLHGFPATDSLASMNSEIGRRVGRFTENINFLEPSLSVNEANPGQFISIPNLGTRPSIDLASFSSTMAVICGESSVIDASAEPNSAGSFRPYRRVGGSSSSGSSHDGGNLRARKRIRLR